MRSRPIARRAVLASAAATALAFLDGGLTPGTLARSGTETPRDARTPRFVAHRGCAGAYPENTVLAARRSALHVDAVEVDVRRCASGELVAFHDARLGRLTDATGRIAETPWSTLRGLTVGTSDEPVARVADVVAALPPGTGVVFDLKHPGVAADVCALASEHTGGAAVVSASECALREVRAAASTLPRGYVCGAVEILAPGTAPLDVAARLGCEAIYPSLGALVIRPSLSGAAHDRGVEVGVWPVGHATTARRLAHAGADALLVDHPRLV